MCPNVCTANFMTISLQGFAAQFAQEITELLLRMPRSLLLLLKTNDCLRSVDYALGQVCCVCVSVWSVGTHKLQTTTQPVNTFTIVARESSRALAEERAERAGGFHSRIVSLVERVSLEIRLLALFFSTVAHSWRIL